jgi:putative pyruvate formate lyase activating enzyme
MNTNYKPIYLSLYQTGELKKRAKMLWQRLNSCDLCPRMCYKNRLKGERGICQATAQMEVSAFNSHFGEERPLVGTRGSGTIFISHCPLRCVFCINWDISIGGIGTTVAIEDLANMMLKLQEAECHNINMVTPTHYSPHILKALDIAAKKGLRLPLVYNTSGYERKEILELLDGIVDIYLPDFKYFNRKMAKKYSAGANDYPNYTKEALLEMNRQVGVAKPGEDGIMYRGLMIRHLVMPNGVSGSKAVINWISKNLPKDTYLNIMAQYQPYYKAHEYPLLARRISQHEYEEVVKYAKSKGFTNLDIQGYY